MNLSVARIICLALGVMLLPATSAASDQDIRWKGFLNVVAGTLRDAPDDRDGPTRHRVYRNYTDQVSFDEETSAGLQAVKPLDEDMTVTAQLMARGNTENYATEMRWLYLSWHPTNNVLLRIGRLGTPLYYFSDFLAVGYSYPWITPPLEVYTFNTTLTGINYRRTGLAGHFEWAVEVMTGAQKQFLPDVYPYGADLDSKNARMAILEVTTGGWLTLRSMLYRMRGTFVIEDLSADVVLDAAMDSLVADGTFDAATANNVIRPLVAPEALPAIDTAIDLEDLDIRYREHAIRIDRGPLLAMAEWIEFDTHSYLLGKAQSWMLAVGWRMGAWTPFITRSATDYDLDHDARADYGTTLGATPSTSELARYLAAQTTSRLSASIASSQDETSLGVRYEASEATAIKVEAGFLDSHATVPDETDYIGDNLILRAGLNVTF